MTIINFLAGAVVGWIVSFIITFLIIALVRINKDPWDV